jgi:hypothetical protein
MFWLSLRNQQVAKHPFMQQVAIHPARAFQYRQMI